MQKIGIIGAGIAGIATAVRLASTGHQVEVFEANDYAGGKLSEFVQDGYRYDAGPSLFTMPQYVEELFALANEPIAAHFQYERLNVICEYFWDDGTRLSAHADPQQFAQAVETQLGVKAEKVHAALNSAAHKYAVSGKIFLEKSLHRFDTWLTSSVLYALTQLPKMDIFDTMHRTHARQSDNNAKLTQLLDRFATYNGSNPYRASGILSIIPHFEHNIGAFYPKGGMYQITESLLRLAERKGVVFHFNAPVQKILTTGKKATALLLQNGEQRDFDSIVSNMDVYFTYKKLLPDAPHPEKTLQQERSTSALIFYWGIRKIFPQLDMHNIFFANDYRQEFDALERGTVSDDPTIYISYTSRYTPSDAPEGCQNWFVMVNVPHNDGSQDWDALITRTRKNVLRKLSHNLQTDIEPLIDSESTLTPLDIERKTSSYGGALYGTSSNDRMAAFLRHPNQTAAFKNLYFCGGSAHPGGGIPLCLLSAKIVSEQVSK